MCQVVNAHAKDKSPHCANLLSSLFFFSPYLIALVNRVLFGFDLYRSTAVTDNGHCSAADSDGKPPWDFLCITRSYREGHCSPPRYGEEREDRAWMPVGHATDAGDGP